MLWFDVDGNTLCGECLDNNRLVEATESGCDVVSIARDDSPVFECDGCRVLQLNVYDPDNDCEPGVYYHGGLALPLGAE
jgi:hypothetical protein